MNRRELLKFLSINLSAGWVSQLWPSGAYAADCELTDHLKGFIPDGHNATISTTGQFHHFHYLHVPGVILANPPANGWTTISSLMVPDLGIADYFFQSAQQRRQFHCHQVYFSNAQLTSIAAGTQTDVLAYIRSESGPQRNHTFRFNRGGTDPKAAFILEHQRIQQIAIREGLRRASTVCQTSTHRGVTVFNSQGEKIVTTQAALQALQGY